MTTYTVGGALPGMGIPSAPQLPPASAQLTPTAEWARGPMAARQPVAEEAMRQQAAALLQHVYRWLEATASTAPQVLRVVPTLVTAVQLYEAQQYPASLELVQSAVGVLQQARWTFPALPPL